MSLEIDGVQISQLSELQQITGNEEVPVQDSKGTFKIKVSSLKSQGPAGKTPVFQSGIITTLSAGEQATCSIYQDGQTEDGSPIYKIDLGIPQGQAGPSGADGDPGQDGQDGSPGQDGVTPVITAKATVDNTTGDPTCVVTKSGTDEAPVFTFAFTGLKGATGAAGSNGQDGEPGSDGKTPVFEVGDVTTLDPGQSVVVSVTADGQDESGNPKYKINVNIPKGQDGAAGSNGHDGSQGPAGKTPVFEVGTVSTLDAGAQATCTVTSDGVDDSGNPKYKINLGIPRGVAGQQGPAGTDGLDGPAGQSGIPSVVDHGTNDTTFELTPNVFHVWGEVTGLTLTLGSEILGVVNEYMFQFTSGTTATSLNLPDTVKYVNSNLIEPNKTYQVSIVNNLVVMGGA